MRLLGFYSIMSVLSVTIHCKHYANTATVLNYVAHQCASKFNIDLKAEDDLYTNLVTCE